MYMYCNKYIVCELRIRDINAWILIGMIVKSLVFVW